MSNLSVTYEALPAEDLHTATVALYESVVDTCDANNKPQQHHQHHQHHQPQSQNDVIILNTSRAEQHDTRTLPSSSTTTTTITAATSAKERPTTPIPVKKLTAKERPRNLHLKISTNFNDDELPKFTETDNATLSSSGEQGPAGTTPGGNDNSSSNSSSSEGRSSTTPTASSSSTASVFPHEQLQAIKRKLDIGFENIGYSVKTGFLRREIKHVLKNVTGNFRSGELSAIVGPSGAGKSTLLNLLSAYTPFGYTGQIRINGKPRDTKTFKPNVAFITQDTSLQPYLTVKEAMHFSANLKIGPYMSHDEKRERVQKILEAIGMYENRHVRTGNLSGGQKKRLGIALELVNNPPVLILDEPTTGLDSSTSYQCISLLKKLAMEGRTVICTIHQASALTFEMFDHLYAVAEGKCIYSGDSQNLVPFLAEVGLQCPESYNPADYLMEIATDDYGKLNDKLSEQMQNGFNESYRSSGISAKETQITAMKKIEHMMEAGIMTPVTVPVFSPTHDLKSPPDYSQTQKQKIAFKQLTPIEEMSSKVWDSRGLLGGDNEQINTKEQQLKEKNTTKAYKLKEEKKRKHKLEIDPPNLCRRDNIYATPFHQQLAILLLRTFLILWRDSSLTTMRFVIHFVTALLIGFLYYGIGNDAGNALNNFRYAFYVIMFIMYCAFSSILVKFPLEFPIVSREHFNRWYSLRAYYIAITLADIPIQMICTGIFIAITYTLTDQPFELKRIFLFSFITFLTSLVAQSIGLAVGASLSVQLGAILGPFFICPFLTFSGFFLQHKDAPDFIKWLFHISFLKYSLEGAVLALFGYDRPRMECREMYCHYSRPKTLLKDLDMANADYTFAAVFLFVLFLALRIIAFYIMSFRLRVFRS